MRQSILISLITTSILFSGCAVKEEVAEVRVDKRLPKVSSLKTISDINAIAFEWPIVDNSAISGYYLYRGDSPDVKLKRVAIIDDKHSSHYVDGGLEPNRDYFYRMSAFSSSGYESDLSNTIRARTLAIIEPVSFISAISDYPKKVKILWRPHSNERVIGYIIERLNPKTREFEELTTVKNRLQASYIDAGLSDNTEYSYRIRAKTFDGIISNPTDTVTAKTKPAPFMSLGLNATTNIAKKIVVTWEKSLQDEVAYYNLYRAEKPDGEFKFYAKVNDTKFTDEVNQDGAVYFYKVSTVDIDNIEGSKQNHPIMGATLNIPAEPIITNATIEDKKAIIRWSSPDNRAVKYTVVKLKNEGLLGTEHKFENIRESMFIDKDIIPNIKYRYSVIAIDEFGLQSNPSAKSELFLRKEAI